DRGDCRGDREGDARGVPEPLDGPVEPRSGRSGHRVGRAANDGREAREGRLLPRHVASPLDLEPLHRVLQRSRVEVVAAAPKRPLDELALLALLVADLLEQLRVAPLARGDALDARFELVELAALCVAVPVGHGHVSAVTRTMLVPSHARIAFLP